jgi:hypothetical protein
MNESRGLNVQGFGNVEGISLSCYHQVVEDVYFFIKIMNF